MEIWQWMHLEATGWEQTQASTNKHNQCLRLQVTYLWAVSNGHGDVEDVSANINSRKEAV
jgi:hypothetical protein